MCAWQRFWFLTLDSSKVASGVGAPLLISLTAAWNRRYRMPGMLRVNHLAQLKLHMKTASQAESRGAANERPDGSATRTFLAICRRDATMADLRFDCDGHRRDETVGRQLLAMYGVRRPLECVADRDDSESLESMAVTYSCKTTLRSASLIFRPPLYSMKPSLRNLFMKKFTRDRVVPTISARVSWESFGKTRVGAAPSP